MSRPQWTRVGRVEPNVTAYDVQKLLEGKSYNFRVMAENSEGLGEAAMLDKPVMPEQEVTVPGAPELLEITSLETDNVTLRWKRPRSDGGAQITNYLLQKREEFKDDWTKVKQTDNYVFSHQIKDLLPDKKYYFRVSAKNSVGLGEPCELPEPVIPSKPAGLSPCLIKKSLIVYC